MLQFSPSCESHRAALKVGRRPQSVSGGTIGRNWRICAIIRNLMLGQWSTLFPRRSMARINHCRFSPAVLLFVELGWTVPDRAEGATTRPERFPVPLRVPPRCSWCVAAAGESPSPARCQAPASGEAASWIFQRSAWWNLLSQPTIC